MNQLPNTIQTSSEIIKEAKQWFKDTGEDERYEPYYIMGVLKSAYDILLKSISEDTRDKFIAASDAPTYEEMAGEEHEDFKDDKPNSQVHPLFKDIIKQFKF